MAKRKNHLPFIADFCAMNEVFANVIDAEEIKEIVPVMLLVGTFANSGLYLDAGTTGMLHMTEIGNSFRGEKIRTGHISLYEYKILN